MGWGESTSKWMPPNHDEEAGRRRHASPSAVLESAVEPRNGRQTLASIASSNALFHQRPDLFQRKLRANIFWKVRVDGQDGLD